MPDLEQLRGRMAELADLASVEMLVHWDQLVMMPGEGAPARAHQLGALARLTHERATAAEIGDWLSELDGVALDGIDRDIVRLARRDWERASRVPEELAVELARAGAEGQESWRIARANDDFAAFAPALERNVELARAYGECVAEERREPRTTRCSATTTSGCAPRTCGALFGELAAALPPLVAEARVRSPRRTLEVPIERAAGGGGEHAAPARRRGVKLARGCLGASLHGMDGPRDTRLTTRYIDGEIESLLSSLHEYGHALYERQIDPLARAHQPRTRHVDVDPRVPEQAVGEPRGTQPGLRGGAGRRAGRRRLRGRARRAARGARRRRTVRRSASPPTRSPIRCTSSCASSSSSR